MTEQYAGALLYLVPVIVAAVVAFVVTRPEKDEAATGTPAAAPLDAIPPTRRIPSQRSYSPAPSAGASSYTGGNRRSTAVPHQSPTLLHAALSSHLAAVSRTATSAAAPLSSKQPVLRPSRLVSIRRPARIPRRPLHQCPHKQP